MYCLLAPCKQMKTFSKTSVTLTQMLTDNEKVLCIIESLLLLFRYSTDPWLNGQWEWGSNARDKRRTFFVKVNLCKERDNSAWNRKGYTNDSQKFTSKEHEAWAREDKLHRMTKMRAAQVKEACNFIKLSMQDCIFKWAATQVNTGQLRVTFNKRQMLFYLAVLLYSKSKT